MKQARDAVAWIALNIGAIFGLIGLFSYSASQSVFKPGTLSTAVTTIISNPTVRNDLATTFANTVAANQSSIVANSTVTATIATALKTALTDPTVESNIKGALNAAQNRLNGLGSAPITISNGALTAAIVNNIPPSDPTLAQAIKSTNLSFTIPGTSLPNLGKIKSYLPRVEHDSLAAAALLIGFAILIAISRAGVIASLGWRIVFLTFFNAFIFYIVPNFVIPALSISWGPVAAIILRAVGGAVATTYATLFIAGVAAIILPRFIFSK
ncbi:MAG: hypothetical protein M0Z45_02475 [Actinomycetota bacterium]|nr:hypothetical protein [Actinomycetota bacterium]